MGMPSELKYTHCPTNDDCVTGCLGEQHRLVILIACITTPLSTYTHSEGEGQGVSCTMESNKAFPPENLRTHTQSNLNMAQKGIDKCVSRLAVCHRPVWLLAKKRQTQTAQGPCLVAVLPATLSGFICKRRTRLVTTGQRVQKGSWKHENNRDILVQ